MSPGMSVDALILAAEIINQLWPGAFVYRPLLETGPSLGQTGPAAAYTLRNGTTSRPLDRYRWALSFGSGGLQH